MSALKFIVGFVTAALCTQDLHAIVNGHHVSSAQLLNSIVAIATETGTCSGIIVGRKTILTAAHCIDVKGAGHTEIPKLVSVQTFDSATTMASKNHFINLAVSSGSAAPGRDIGYIYLVEDLTLRGDPVPLDFTPISETDELCVAGIGRDENDISGSLKIRCSMSMLLDTGAGLLFLKDQKDPKAGVAPGDSGGPVFRKLRDGTLSVVGVISRGGDGKGTPFYKPENTMSLVTPISYEYTRKWISDYKCLRVNGELADNSLCTR